MLDFVDQKRSEMKARLNELRPMAEEFHRLEEAIQALDKEVPAPAVPARSPRRPSHSRTSTPTKRKRGDHSSPRPKRGRPKGSGLRAKQALEMILEKPGITIPEIAQKMGIKQNYLYRVLPGIKKDGLIYQRARGWHPTKKAKQESEAAAAA